MDRPSALAPGRSLTAPAARAPGVRLAIWLAPFALLGVALVRLYPDSYQADAGYHFLFARWGLAHPALLVDVWGRPLFSLLYALPAQLGYPAAKLLTVAVSLAAAWQTARLARDEGLERPELAVPLLLLQPSFLLICSDTMTEPLFALVLVVALRLHRAGRVGAGMRVAALLPLARPEGFFVALLWGAFVALDRRAGPSFPRRLLSTAWLASGVAAWWLLALLLTGDPLFLLHNWPRNWGGVATYGSGPLLQYWKIREEVLAGKLLWALLGLGGLALLLRRRLWLSTAAMALVVVLHSVFYRHGLFGSAGYARYLVCVAPPMALCLLAGWNLAALPLRLLPRLPARALAGAAALALVAFTGHRALRHVDKMGPSRDPQVVDEAHAWFEAHPQPVSRLVFSQPYMSILFGRDPSERPPFGNDAGANVELLRASPPGTLVFWDAHTGPLFRKMTAADVERAGYRLLFSAHRSLGPRFPWLFDAPPPPYQQEVFLYYKG